MTAPFCDATGALCEGLGRYCSLAKYRNQLGSCFCSGQYDECIDTSDTILAT
jgi:hypothetical protein